MSAIARQPVSVSALSAFCALALLLASTGSAEAAARKAAAPATPQNGPVIDVTAPSLIKSRNVGGSIMREDKTIMENLAAAKNMTVITALAKAAGLADTLQGAGPYTLLAPSDDAFAKLPQGTLEALMKPENRNQLVQVLTYHLVNGEVGLLDMLAAVQAGGGTTTLKTVEGESLTVKQLGEQLSNVQLIDGKGVTAAVTTPTVKQSNGIIHVIDTVLVLGKAPQ